MVSKKILYIIMLMIIGYISYYMSEANDVRVLSVSDTVSDLASAGDDSGRDANTLLSIIYKEYGKETPNCSPMYICDDWSECINDISYRVCKDYNNCTKKVKRDIRKCNASSVVKIEVIKERDNVYSSEFDETVQYVMADVNESKFLVYNGKNGIIYYAEKVGDKRYVLRVVDEDLVNEGKIDKLIRKQSVVEKYISYKDYRFWMYFSFFTFLLASIEAIIFLYIRYKKGKVNRYAYQELVNYVRNSSLDREDLIYELEKVGWSRKDIEKAIDESKKPN